MASAIKVAGTPAAARSRRPHRRRRAPLPQRRTRPGGASADLFSAAREGARRARRASLSDVGRDMSFTKQA